MRKVLVLLLCALTLNAVQARQIIIKNNLQDTMLYVDLQHYDKKCLFGQCFLDLPKLWLSSAYISPGKDAVSGGDSLADWTWGDYWQLMIMTENTSTIKLYQTSWQECDIANNTSVLTFYVNNLSDNRDIHIDADGSGQCDIRGSNIELLDIIDK